MTIKDQLVKLKENWLLLAAVLVVLIFLNIGSFSLPLRQIGSASVMQESLKAGAAAGEYYSNDFGIVPPIPSYGDFAPGVKDRKITKSSSLTTEVGTGNFKTSESNLKSIIKSTNSFLLNENVNNYGSGRKSYYSGSYQIKVDSTKYDDVTAQLKGIGEVKSFNENSEDITASFKNLEIEIAAEQQKLDRYKKMYEDATLVADKIQLSDRIFEEERTLKYLEDSLKNQGQRVDYSTIYFTLNEKQPKFYDIKFVEFSELVRNLVASINSLLNLVFVALPYAVAALVLWLIIRFFRRRT